MKQVEYIVHVPAQLTVTFAGIRRSGVTMNQAFLRDGGNSRADAKGEIQTETNV